MEFRAPSIAKTLNAAACEYLTANLSNPELGRSRVDVLIKELGNAVDSYPDWHPILTSPKNDSMHDPYYISQINTYDGINHTREFVRGFITCPYSEDAANQLVGTVNNVSGLHARRLPYPLYTDNAYPVVIEAHEVQLEADGTIRSRDALRWFVQKLAEETNNAQVAETWWNIRSLILGRPHGSRSSLLVNQHTGAHMRKILETLNNSGIFGQIKEDSLDMLSKKKRDSISRTLIRTTVKNWDKKSKEFSFELRGETCKAAIRDTWDDGHELSIRVEIGDYDLLVTGFYYAKEDKITFTAPRGKQLLAKKFC